jgi:hypothetical protein
VPRDCPGPERRGQRRISLNKALTLAARVGPPTVGAVRCSAAGNLRRLFHSGRRGWHDRRVARPLNVGVKPRKRVQKGGLWLSLLYFWLSLVYRFARALNGSLTCRGGHYGLSPGITQVLAGGGFPRTYF